MTPLTLLEAERKNPAIIQDGRALGHEEVLEKVAQLKLRLYAYRRAMVASSEALTVVSALAACQALDIPLWIGHEFAGAAALDAISKSQRIDVRIGNAIETTPIADPALEREAGGFAVHIMTSGTTGTPKIARHSLDALMGRVSQGTLFGGSWLLTYPPSTFAGIQVLLTAVSSGSALVAFRAQSVPQLSDAIARYAITHSSATPTFWRAALMFLHGSSEISSLRQITIGGEIVDQALLDQLAGKFPNARIIHIYASTEAGSLFSVKDGRAGFPAAWLSTKIDGVELRIQGGVLEVRSPRRMQSYVSAHASPCADDGWLSTGDLVEVREDRVCFSGRKDNIINVGGSKVLPEEVERFVLGIEGVADVCVTGVKNPMSGAVLKAEVVASPGVEPEGLRKTIAQRCHSALPAYQVPRIIVMVPRIGVSAAGKKSGGVS
jgi:acyl-coenzyme A synthetase/AMP-(fatty) acid ligase